MRIHFRAFSIQAQHHDFFFKDVVAFHEYFEQLEIPTADIPTGGEITHFPFRTNGKRHVVVHTVDR